VNQRSHLGNSTGVEPQSASVLTDLLQLNSLRIFMIHRLAALLACIPAGCADDLPTAPVASWSATDVRGIEYRTLAAPNTVAIVLIFTMQDCPIANGYVPEFNRLHEEFGGRGVRFFLIQTDPAISEEAGRQHAEDYAIRFPVLLDRDHRFVRLAGASRTPEAAVYSIRGELSYRGRIDDRYADYGKRRAEPTTRDLRTALEQILSGKPVTTPRTKVVGCHIPLLEHEES
jgi:peroxiredoxin